MTVSLTRIGAAACGGSRCRAPEPRATLECWIEGQTVRIETSGAEKLDVDLGPNGLRMSGEVTVMVNGKQRFTGPVPEKPLSLVL